jgi:hypothetical protein
MGQQITKGTTFSSGDTVTHLNLNAHVDTAQFIAGSGNTTDDQTLEVHSNGYLKIKAGASVAYNLSDTYSVTNIRQLTQAQYNALTPDSSTLYVVT